MATRCAAARSTRARSSRHSQVDEGSDSFSGSGIYNCSNDEAPAFQVDAGLLPRLDDNSRRTVLSHLPSKSLTESSLVSKAWQDMCSDDSLWRQLLTSVDTMSALGHDRLRDLSLQFSCKQVVSELSTRSCSFCREPTNGFFLLTCTRVCLPCFQTNRGVTMCSLSYAKSHFLLSKYQASRIPKLRVEFAGETGCVATRDASITVTTCSAAKASAVTRWGSEEAFEAEMARRKSKAESSYEARKRAYDQRATASTSSALPGQVAPNNDAQSPGDRLPYPSRPRILDLGNAKNYVGVNQQKHNRIRGEKYGFFTVVNEAFFDSGPKIALTGDPDDSDYGKKIGRRLAEVLNEAKPGTTIKLAALCVLPSTLCVERSVRILGENFPKINAPCIIRNLRISQFPVNLDDNDDDVGLIFSLRTQSDLLVEDCRFSASPYGAAVLLRSGHLWARRNTFDSGTSALMVFPFPDYMHLDATVSELEGNTFSNIGAWCIGKGPARCHPQDDATILAANDFSAIATTVQILKQH